jgi:deoxyribonuclease-4
MVHDLNYKTYGELLVEMRPMGVGVVQMFVLNPHSADDVDLDLNSPTGAAQGIKIYIHANYLSHMCLTATTGIIHKQIKRLDVIQKCTGQDRVGFVVHLENESLERNIEAADRVLNYAKSFGVQVIFEINAVTVGPIFDRPEVCRAFVQELSKNHNKQSFGLCVDTAHLWSSGVDLSSSADVVKWFEGFVDPTFIRLIHLNDSANELGGADKHAPIGHGKMWEFADKNGNKSFEFVRLPRHPNIPKTQELGFIQVLRYAKKYNIDVILERGRESARVILDEFAGVRELRQLLR